MINFSLLSISILAMDWFYPLYVIHLIECIYLKANMADQLFPWSDRSFQRVIILTAGNRELQSLTVKCLHHDGGCSWTGELSQLGMHLTKCSSELSACKYSSLGCKAKMAKKKLTVHEEECSTEHLKMAIQKVNSLAERLQALELRGNVGSQSSHSPCNLPPVVFKLSNLTRHRENKIIWESPPFYSQPKGYKLYLKVDCSGRSLSVEVCLMHGEYDDHLIWPFRGIIHFGMLNQFSDDDHELGEAKFLERRDSDRNRRVTAAQGKSKVGWKFIFFPQLNTADMDLYDDRDCVFIRVCRVEVLDSNKPWLI